MYIYIHICMYVYIMKGAITKTESSKASLDMRIIYIDILLYMYVCTYSKM